MKLTAGFEKKLVARSELSNDLTGAPSHDPGVLSFPGLPKQKLLILDEKTTRMLILGTSPPSTPIRCAWKRSAGLFLARQRIQTRSHGQSVTPEAKSEMHTPTEFEDSQSWRSCIKRRTFANTSSSAL